MVRSILLLLVLCGGCGAVLVCNVTNETVMDDNDVLERFEAVFPPSDQTTLRGTGSQGIAHIRHILNRTAASGCPAFTVSEKWTCGRELFSACMMALVGNMANTELEPGGAFVTFNLNTHDGTIMKGWRDKEASQSSTILSALIIVLLLALGILMIKGGVVVVPSAK